MRRLLPLLSLPLFALACSAQADDGASTNESAVEVFAPDLWAGLASYTIERYAADPCNNGQSRLDDQPIGYDSWARQRAAIRRVCFEVWKPGVTDTENPDYWRLLDVQVHYRYAGTSDWKMAYVPAIDRRGNNRRYAWDLSWDLDPLGGYNVADAKAPFEILREDERSAQVRSELEFYFTVNGHKLSTSTNHDFRVAYTSIVEKPSSPTPFTVLYPDVVCGGGALTVGSGPGYFAAVVTDQAAIDALDTSGMIPSAYTHVEGTLASRSLSVHFSSLENTPQGQLPRYVEGMYAPSWRAETRDAGPGKLTLSVKAYDRNAKTLRTSSYTFDQCVKR